MIASTVEIATLFVGVIAASAATAALVLGIRWRRPQLVGSFSRDFSASESAIILRVRFENRGQVLIPKIDVYAGAPGDHLSPTRNRLERFALQPGEWYDLDVTVPRPARIEMQGAEPVLKVPFTVMADYGRGRLFIPHPTNPEHETPR